MGNPNQQERCYICDRETEADDYCFGCREWICKACDRERPSEPHEPDDHRRYPAD